MGRNLRVQKSVGGGDPAAAADPQHRPEPLMVGGGRGAVRRAQGYQKRASGRKSSLTMCRCGRERRAGKQNKNKKKTSKRKHRTTTASPVAQAP